MRRSTTIAALTILFAVVLLIPVHAFTPGLKWNSSELRVIKTTTCASNQTISLQATSNATQGEKVKTQIEIYNADDSGPSFHHTTPVSGTETFTMTLPITENTVEATAHAELFDIEGTGVAEISYNLTTVSCNHRLLLPIAAR